jgi:hypothetical protein
MEVDLRAGFVRFYCQVNLEKYNRLALLTWFAYLPYLSNAAQLRMN